MAYPIKYLLLQKLELCYEVAIRGETPAESVEGLRRQINKLTQLYPADEILDSVYSYTDDCDGCRKSLEKIKTNLESLVGSYNDSLFSRTRSCLNHVYYRIQRVQKPDSSEDPLSLSKVQKLYDNYNAVLIGLDKTSGEPKPHASATTDEEAGDRPGVSGLNVSVTCERSITSELSKLKYDGKSCVRAFIQKVEEFRISKGVTENKMLLSATDIFTGDALHWYRSIKNILTDWPGLLTHLKEDFDLPDYDYRMSSEIRERTQGDEESIIVYLSIMEGMFSRLSTLMSEECKLDILLHNIRPCYSTIIAASPNIKTIGDLRQVCRNYERIKTRSDNFREPPSFHSKMLAPEFCYQKRKELTKNYNGQTINKVSEISAISAPRKFCIRCRVDTHSSRECTAERTIFCFGCGEKGIRRPDCPKCKNVATSSSKNL